MNKHESSSLLAKGLRTVLVLLAMAVVASLVPSLWFQQSGGLAPIPWSVLCIGWLIAILTALATTWISQKFLERVIEALGQIGCGLLLTILVGLSLRLAFALIVSPNPTSDGASYLSLAQELVTTGSYGSEGRRAYWPPGLPLVLATLLWSGLPTSTAILTYGLLSYVVASIGIWRLSLRLELQQLTTLPLWLLALWPTHILCTGLPEKELLIIALMPWIADRTIVAMRGSMVAALSAGILTGLAILVQPSLQLLPIAFIIAALVLRLSFREIFAGALAGILATILVIAPWTYRNYQIFGSVVPVSTNGGDVLYRANNEKASGAYVPEATIQLRHFDERVLDLESKRLALIWIKQHPGQFVQLSMGKILLFMGDDSFGAYASLKRGTSDTPRPVYLAVKTLSAVPWLLVWVFLLALLMKRPLIQDQNLISSAWITVLPILYLLAIHSIFESGGRYHLPVLALVLVLVAYAAESRRLLPQNVLHQK